MLRNGGPLLRRAAFLFGLVLLPLSAWYLVGVVEAGTLRDVTVAVATDPLGLLVATSAYAAAFALRGWAWRRSLPALGLAQAWSALHVALLGNHVLPARLGEALRVTSVIRRTLLPAGPVTASAVSLRAADVLAVVALASVAGLSLLEVPGGWVAGIAAVAMLAVIVSAVWIQRLRRQGAAIRLPDPPALAATALAWVLEAAVVLAVAQAAGIDLSAMHAVAVTAATMLAQALAVTPGGIGTYEAAATAALVAAGVPPAEAFAVALTTHAVKTAYALLVGTHALFWPAPGYWGRFRLPRRLPPRPTSASAVEQPLVDAPVVVMIPVHNEEATIGAVVHRLPARLAEHPVRTLVVNDGSVDRSAQLAAAAGAAVIHQPRNVGLGAAVRRGLAEASDLNPAAVVYLDGDLEYDPAELATLAGPILDGSTDYVVGSRFAGDIRRMLPQRRLGNQVLTAWMRWMTRRRDLTDGQSGYRAFSPRAAAEAEIVHDYNYAQVLTLDLLAKGFVYREVPISYAFRRSGTSFVRLGSYLRKVLPAVHRELNQTTPDPTDPSPLVRTAVAAAHRESS